MNTSLLKKVFIFYKKELTLCLILSIIVIAFRLETSLINIISIILGFPLGMLILDIDYLLFAYIINPSHHFSQMLTSLIRDRNLPAAVNYFMDSRHEVTASTIRSALFQIIILLTALFSVISHTGLLSSCFILGMASRLFYEQYLLWKAKQPLDGWFTNLNFTVTRRSLMYYFVVIALITFYCFYLLISFK